MGFEQQHPVGAFFHEQGEVRQDVPPQQGGDTGHWARGWVQDCEQCGQRKGVKDEHGLQGARVRLSPNTSAWRTGGEA